MFWCRVSSRCPDLWYINYGPLLPRVLWYQLTEQFLHSLPFVFPFWEQLSLSLLAPSQPIVSGGLRSKSVRYVSSTTSNPVHNKPASFQMGSKASLGACHPEHLP